MSTTYDVTLALHTTGNLDAHVTRMGAAAEKCGASVGRIGSSFRSVGDTFESVGTRIAGTMSGIMEKAGSVALSLAKWGAVGAVGLAAYGVAKLNSELESTRISLATTFTSAGLVNFHGGMNMAADQIEKMKKDVNTLPGTFGQLASLMQIIAPPGMAGGMNPDQLRKFAGPDRVPNSRKSCPHTRLLACRAG